MANLAVPQAPLGFVKKHWFQITLGLIFLYLLLSKNLSFSVNFQSPANIEQIKTHKKRQVMTDAGSPTALVSEEKLSFISNTSSLNSLNNINENKKVIYLKRFAHVAVEEQKKFKIPASVILATGLLHSKAGTAEYAKTSNNQFALRCFDNWDKERMLLEGNCYRKYKTAWLSFRDNSHFLSEGKFKNLSRLGIQDYKNWAKGLEELRYSPEPNFSNQLIQLIEKYKLYELDK